MTKFIESSKVCVFVHVSNGKTQGTSSNRGKSSYINPRSAENVEILFQMPMENAEVPNTDASISALRARKCPHSHTARNSHSNLSLVRREAYPEHVLEVNVRSVVGDDHFSLSPRQNVEKSNKLRPHSPISSNHKG